MGPESLVFSSLLFLSLLFSSLFFSSVLVSAVVENREVAHEALPTWQELRLKLWQLVGEMAEGPKARPRGRALGNARTRMTALLPKFGAGLDQCAVLVLRCGHNSPFHSPAQFFLDMAYLNVRQAAVGGKI